ncbi:MAG TPA: class I SAM-dependent rRNA methyltransferase [Azospirillaceae bacterium]|nr:class I SAM-dependent rRNA methyltransferase [Azospirillaceae bacterium]
MIDKTTLPLVRLHTGRHKRALLGHPWIYSNEIQMEPAVKALPPGALIRLVAAGGEFLGIATFNPHTLIAARILSRDAGTTVDRDWLTRRLARALALRNRLYDRPFYRLVHAEADGLPALVVDRYGDVLVVQPNSAAMERLLSDILAALDTVVGAGTIVVRRDSTTRVLEGLPEQEPEVVKGTLDGPLALEENGGTFFADVSSGQKTGWFYDQRDNRAAVAAFAKGGRVIDFYSYNGGFAVLAAQRGAAHVTAVDRSQLALDMGARAAEANGVADRCSFMKTDAFAELERLAVAGETFDVVIADPPAFVKSKKDLPAGTRAYRKMTRLSAKITAPGGILLVASCSHNMEPALFAEQVARGLNDAGRTGRILRSSGAAADHPVHPFLPESAYLKAQILQLD